jgi:endoglucanase
MTESVHATTETAQENTPRVAPERVSDTRFARLAQGINMSHWFAQVRSYEVAHLQTYITQRDVELIEEMGFSHVRLTLNPEILLDVEAPQRLEPQVLELVDGAIGRFLAAGLAVIVDPHPEDAFKFGLRDNDAMVSTFATFWETLARHLTRYNPDDVFLEVLNEPVMQDAARWQAIQRTLLAAMRAGAPEHTLIATAHRWSSVTELLTLEPVDDPNVLYNFHCYDPHLFTHQGAHWSMKVLPYLSQLPYPSSPEVMQPLLESIEHDEAREAARTYGEERWDAEKLEAFIMQAVAWAETHGVRLTCNEFGVYRRVSRPEHRVAWLRDLVRILERHHIGWTMWDYAGDFAVVNQQDGTRVPDQATLDALGLA